MVGRAGRKIGGEGIQMHGDVGMTDELAVCFFVEWPMIANTLFGNADYQQQRFTALVNASSEVKMASGAA